MSLSQARRGSRTQRHDPYMAYNFVVELGGLIVGGFAEVTGLSSKIELESYAEGGINGYVHQFPKQVTYPNLVLSRGLIDDELWQWYQKTARGNIQLQNGTIILQDSQQLPVMRCNFKQAYPVAWEGPQLNASSAQVAVERLELIHQGVEIKWEKKG